MNDFTTKLKDDILMALCNEIPAEVGLHSINATVLVKEVNSDMNTVLAVLKQFERNGLISELNAHPSALRLILMVEGVEFRNRGGFKVYEDLYKLNFEKLQLEIENLKQTSPESAEKMVGLMANLATISQFIFTPFS